MDDLIFEKQSVKAVWACLERIAINLKIKDTESLSLAVEIEERISALLKERSAMLEAMKEFVERCERGEVQSTYTYNKFRAIIQDAESK
jgi:hypothetical protein